MTNARVVRLAWLGIALATIVAYAPALRAPFLFDDAIIGEASSIRQIWPPSIPLHPGGRSTPVTGRPVVNYTLALNYVINARLGIDQRPDPQGAYKTVGYHLFNVLLHLVCGLLLFGVLRRTLRGQRFSERWASETRADRASLLITGIWLLHPIQTEAVNYIVQRTEIIVSACYLGTLYASIRAWDAATALGRTRWCVCAVVVCLVGMGSKEVMISAPLIVVLYDVVFRWTGVVEPESGPPHVKTDSRRPGSGRQPAADVPAVAPISPVSPWKLVVTGGRGRFYLALCATSVVLIALMLGGPRSDTVGFNLGLAWYVYFYSQAWAILHYIRLFFWPDRLTLDYGPTPVHGLGGVPGLIVLGVFAIATVVAWTRVRTWGWFGFVGAWFFLLLAPSSSIVPITTEVAAERRIYLALVSVIVLTLVGADALWQRFARTSSNLRPVPGWGILAAWSGVGVLLTVATFERSEVYRNVIGMWHDVVAKAPGNPRGYGNLAAQLLEQRPPQEAEAVTLLRHALVLDSTLAPAMVDLAGVASKHGDDSTAEALYERALIFKPDDAWTLSHLGMLLQSRGDVPHAIPYYQRLVTIQPDAWALFHLAAALENQHEAERAVPYFERLVSMQPTGLSLALLSRAFAESGRVDDAVTAERIAAVRSDNTAETLSALGDAELALGKRDSAIVLYRRAVAVKPDYGPGRKALDSLTRGR